MATRRWSNPAKFCLTANGRRLAEELSDPSASALAVKPAAPATAAKPTAVRKPSDPPVPPVWSPPPPEPSPSPPRPSLPTVEMEEDDDAAPFEYWYLSGADRRVRSKDEADVNLDGAF